MKKKLFTLLVLLMTAVTGAWAAPEPCGQNLTWDLTGGVLTISGTGDMYDYDDEENYAPWVGSAESITSVIIPDGVTRIGNCAFFYCTGLASIEIPNSVTSIGAGAFMQCTGLTSVTIPNNVTSIGAGAFLFCTGLTSIEIPNSVTSIGDGAFLFCTGLETVTINAESLESYGSGAFDNTHADLKIYVPAGSVDTYKAAWAAYEDKIEASAEPVTVYFTDAKGWGDVKVYYWPNGTEWPGNAMTYVEDNEYNQKVYKAQVPANVEGIVFNGNGKQTVNITENIANNAWWYSDAEDGDGKFTVGYVGKYLAVEPTQNPNEWAFAMPAYDLELEMEYYPLATLATLPAAAEGLNDATTADLLTPGTSTEGTLYYALGTSEAPTGQWSTDIPTTEGLEAGQYYVWYKVVGDAEHSDSQPQSIAVTVAALPTYAVTIDDAGVDAANWQATPAEQRAGQTVTLSYGGKKKIRSITIEAAAAAPAPTLAQTMTTAGITVKVTYNFNDEENYCLFLSNGDDTYTFQSGEGYTGGDESANALVVEDGKLVFKQNFFTPIDENWDEYGFSVTIDTSNNTYSQWAGESSQETFSPSFISVEVNGTQIAVTAAQ